VTVGGRGNSGRRRRQGNRRDDDGHGGDGRCRFLGVANLIEVRKLQGILYLDNNGLGGGSKFGIKKYYKFR
jgi:hypothetical protein